MSKINNIESYVVSTASNIFKDDLKNGDINIDEKWLKYAGQPINTLNFLIDDIDNNYIYDIPIMDYVETTVCDIVEDYVYKHTEEVFNAIINELPKEELENIVENCDYDIKDFNLNNDKCEHIIYQILLDEALFNTDGALCQRGFTWIDGANLELNFRIREYISQLN